jgi:exodeoxyribonuclease VII large subunit
MSADRNRRDTRPLTKGMSRATSELIPAVLVEPEKRFFTLSQVQKSVHQHLQPALDAPAFWVAAELSDVSHNKHFYCTLVESVEGRQVAKMRCHIWSGKLLAMKRRYAQDDLSFDLQNGTKVGLLCKVAYHDVYGLSLNAIDIDPNFALGELERRRRELLKRLTQAGLLDKNKKRKLPLLPQRIGLIASRDSASLSDFIRTLHSSPYGFVIWLAEAQVQGVETEASVMRALRRLESAELDLIVLVRGGGSRTELSFLDNETIARAIAHCRLPVWTGIGHETDTSVLDAVAAQAFRTPTAVAEMLVATFKEVDHLVAESRARLHKTIEMRLVSPRQRLEALRDGIRRASLGVVKRKKQRHAQWKQQVADLSFGILKSEKQRRVHWKQQFSSSSSGVLRQWRQRLEHWQGVLRSRPSQRLTVQRAALKAQRVELTAASRHLIQEHRELTARGRRELSSKRLEQWLNRYWSELDFLDERLFARSTQRLKQSMDNLERFKQRFRLERYLRRLKDSRTSLESWRLAIKSADPQNILERGFAMVRDQQGNVILGVDGVKAGDLVTVTLKDGEFDAKTEGTRTNDG